MSIFKRLVQYVQGWCVTLDIKFNHPELYQELTQPYDMDLSNFTEVERPTE